MAFPTAVHQLIDYLSWGDAVSNHTRLLRDLLRSWGISSEVYVLDCDPELVQECLPLNRCHPGRDDWLIYQYSLDSPLTEFALARAKQTFLSYHNITPPSFFAVFDPRFAARLQRAVNDLGRMRGLAGAISVSRYNCRQLEELGFNHVRYVPLLYLSNDLLSSEGNLQGRRLYKGLKGDPRTILFVGRIAPNKRVEHVILAFAYYQKLVEPDSRLCLVGASPHPIYQAYLDMLVESLELTDRVVFAGKVPLRAGFGAYYRASDVFLCLSEHEGFGVPLVESMYFDVPVIAYKAGAVPETLGDSGILVTEKRNDLIGELINLLVSDSALRHQVVRKQRERLAAFERGIIENQIKAWLESLDASG